MLITDERRPHTLRQWVIDPLPAVRPDSRIKVDRFYFCEIGNTNEERM